MEKNINEIFDDMLDTVMSVEESNSIEEPKEESIFIDKDDDFNNIEPEVEILDDDFNSLLSSSNEFDVDWEDNEIIKSIPKNEKIDLEETLEELKEKENISVNNTLNSEDLLNILDSSNNSEEFFDKIEELNND